MVYDLPMMTCLDALNHWATVNLWTEKGHETEITRSGQFPSRVLTEMIDFSKLYKKEINGTFEAWVSSLVTTTKMIKTIVCFVVQLHNQLCMKQKEIQQETSAIQKNVILLMILRKMIGEDQ